MQNYDFLYDEEYQQYKIQKEKVAQDKWNMLCEKLCMKFSMKSINETISEVNRIINRQCTNQELLLNTSHIKGSQIKKSKDDILYSKRSNSNIFTTILKECEILTKNSILFVDNDRELCAKYEKEKEKSMLLERELRRYRNQDQDILQDLELQLKETRSSLLEKNLNITDKEEEIYALRIQLDQMQSNLYMLEQEKNEIDTLVIKVSQQLQGKEFEVHDYNQQILADKQTLQRQVTLLKREIQEERQRNQSLNIVEEDLLYKLQLREQDSMEQKQYLNEFEEKLSVKTDAIEKAHKVIQRLTEELEKIQVCLEQLEQEKDQMRSENRDLNRKIVEMNKQLQYKDMQSAQAQSQMNCELRTEVHSLKDALKQYQEEYENDKRALMDSIRQLNEQKYDLINERDKLEQQNKKLLISIDENGYEIESVEKLQKERIKKLEQEIKELDKQYQSQIQQREQLAQNNILYMQRRFKEFTTQQQDFKGPTSLKTEPFSLVIKQEFDKVADEFSALRRLIKEECSSWLCIDNKLKLFDTFQHQVINQLKEWEVNVAQILEISNQYQKDIDEQRVIFNELKRILKEKDSLIYQMQREKYDQQRHIESNINQASVEMKRQNYIINEELLSMNSFLLQDKAMFSKENDEMGRRFESFKQEYVKTLEEKDYLQSNQLILQGQIEVLMRQCDQIDNEFLSYRQHLGIIMNLKSIGDIEHTIESMCDEIKIKREELIHYKEKLQQYEKESTDEKIFLKERIQKMEEQCEQIQRQSLDKEEEQHILFLQKETKFANEIQRQESELTRLSQELRIKEKQIRKVFKQLQGEKDEKQSLNSQIYTLEQQINDHLDTQKKLDENIYQISLEMQKIQDNLEEKQLRIRTFEMEQKQWEEKREYLSDALQQCDKEIQKEKRFSGEIQQEKYELINEVTKLKDSYKYLEKENHQLYGEIDKLKQDIEYLDGENQQIAEEKQSIEGQANELNKLLQETQDEMLQLQQNNQTQSQQIEKLILKEKELISMHYELNLQHQNQKQQQSIINDLTSQINKPKCSQSIQTSDSGIQEIKYLKDELIHTSREHKQQQSEIEQLRDALLRQSRDIDRLISEKRDLEELVDQQNLSIKQIRLNQSTTGVRDSLLGSCSSSRQQNQTSNQLYERILQEKENYIFMLENEIGEQRKDSDKLREKLLLLEMNTIAIPLRENNELQNQSVKFNKSSYSSTKKAINNENIRQYY